MKTFELARAATLEQARELHGKAGSLYKAGGIDLLDHMKERLLEPERLVDLKRVPGLDRVEPQPDGGLRLGPLVTLAQVARDEAVRRGHLALAEACALAASPQIRNVATLGGNLLQRPRCWYYRLESYKCFKKGGETCFAVDGENRYHSIFGEGPVFAPHPSNAATALVALHASFELLGARGTRTVAAGEFFTLPSVDATRENVLQPGEILTAIVLPPPVAGARSTYTDVRERPGFDWPLVALAASLRTDGGVVRQASLVLGAVAPIPWRAAAAEKALVGRRLDEASARQAAEAAVQGAAPLSDNGYKLELTRALVRRALLGLA